MSRGLRNALGWMLPLIAVLVLAAAIGRQPIYALLALALALGVVAEVCDDRKARRR